MDHPERIIENFKVYLSPEPPAEEPAQAPTGPRPLRVRVDERNLQTGYVNGFRPMMTAEEVMLDFGLNLVRLTGDSDHPQEPVFQASHRLIMSYYCAKRLALDLTQIVRRFEEQFGAIELDAAKRRTAAHPQNR